MAVCTPSTFLYFVYSLRYLYLLLNCLNSTLWLPILLIILSNDIELNPGPHSYEGLTFLQWNINSLGKDDFSRVKLLQAQNAIYNYDIISRCETSLNEQIELPTESPLMEGYEFKSLNHPSGEKRGGVGIFYKENRPLKIRPDLSFEECLVSEILIGRKKIFYTVMYRSPSNRAGSPEFQ